MNQYPVEPYHVEQRPSTEGNALLSSSKAPASLQAYVLLASLSLTSTYHAYHNMFPAFPTFISIIRPSTVGQFGNIFATTCQPQSVNFEGAITAFYSTLLAKQQPLGAEFERVLYDNLSDLYVRS
jgi:hypothetical protein